MYILIKNSVHVMTMRYGLYRLPPQICRFCRASHRRGNEKELYKNSSFFINHTV